MQTKAEAEAELQEWYRARQACQQGQSLTIQTTAGSRTLVRQDLAEIQKIIERLEKFVSRSTRQPFARANFQC